MLFRFHRDYWRQHPPERGNLKDMAYNTAMIVNGLISQSPVYTSQSVSNIPAIYSKITLMTKDSY
jgi:putative multiple sugar transport system substrate-binding protein